MSTNYYWTPSLLNPHRNVGPLHIGKRAGGWSFMFQGFDDASAHSSTGTSRGNKPLQLRSWDDWKALLATPGVIYNEYDEKVAFEEFVQMVEIEYAPTGVFNGRQVLNHVTYLRTEPRYKDNLVYQDESLYWCDSKGYAFSLGTFS